MQAFKDFLKDVKVTSISFDAGSEFNNKKLLDLFEENGINVFSFNKKISPNATAIIERFNKTIRDKITKYKITNKTKNFIDILSKLVQKYNKITHSTIKKLP